MQVYTVPEVRANPSEVLDAVLISGHTVAIRSTHPTVDGRNDVAVILPRARYDELMAAVESREQRIRDMLMRS